MRTGLLRTSGAEVSRVRSRPRPLVWAPARSWGGVIGIAIVALTFALAVGLGIGLAATGSAATRLVGLLLEFPIIVALSTAVAGTWRYSTTAYVLMPSALEVRHGLHRLRVRYQDVVRVSVSDTKSISATNLLWPDAPAGDLRLESGRVARWWGTTLQPASRVLVETRTGAVLLTPDDAIAFRETLLASVPGTALPSTERTPRRGWLELVAALDSWFRAVAALAVAVAAGGFIVEVLTMGSTSRHMTLATLGLVANLIPAALIAPRVPYAARMAAGATLVLVCLGALI